MDQEGAKSIPRVVTSSAKTAVAGEQAGRKITARVGYFRWIICALLLFGTTKNYMDRNVLGVLKETLQHTLGWSEVDYGNLTVVFQAGYALGMLVVGWIIDRLGTRLGYALSMIFWSAASMGTALCNSLASFAVARCILGFGEAAIFPASIKAVAEWFPKKERALATGIFNAGTNVGAMLAPVTVAWISLRWGWRGAFVGIGGIGFLLLVLWLLLYQKPEEHPKLSKAELDYIRSDPQDAVQKIPWITLVPLRQTWTFAVGKFLTDPVWWFYLFWMPGFFQTKHGLSLTKLGPPLIAIYVIADIGSVVGGWISSFLIRHGRSINASRKTALLICAVGVIPVVFAFRVESTLSAVLLIGLAAACHQGFSANLYTITSDMFPAEAVGSVTGIGGMAGAIGGLCIAAVVGHVLQWTGSYMIPFLIAGFAYLVALGMIQLLSPRLEPAKLK